MMTLYALLFSRAGILSRSTRRLESWQVACYGRRGYHCSTFVSAEHASVECSTATILLQNGVGLDCCIRCFAPIDRLAYTCWHFFTRQKWNSVAEICGANPQPAEICITIADRERIACMLGEPRAWRDLLGIEPSTSWLWVWWSNHCNIAPIVRWSAWVCFAWYNMSSFDQIIWLGVGQSAVIIESS